MIPGAARPVRCREEFLGDRLVGLDQAQHQGREVDLGEVGAAGAGLDLGDPQERGEGREDGIRVLDRPVDGALIDRGLGRTEPRQLQPVAQPAERCPEVVRDVVGDLLQVQEQRLDSIEHAVEVKGQLGELVARTRAPTGMRRPSAPPSTSRLAPLIASIRRSTLKVVSEPLPSARARVRTRQITKPRTRSCCIR